MNYKKKYLKYKLKYLTAKKLYGGMFDSDDEELPASFKSSYQTKEDKKKEIEEDIKRTAKKYPEKTTEIAEKIIKAAELRHDEEQLMKKHRHQKNIEEEAEQEAQGAEQKVRKGIKQENSKRLKEFKKNTGLPDF